MNSVNSRWFRWVADHSHYLFWIIWGAGLGSFATVFLGGVNLGGDLLRVYLAILTAMMGGALGLVTSRAMDQVGDLRSRRRKVYAARLRIRALRGPCERFAKFAAEAAESDTTLEAYVAADRELQGRTSGILVFLKRCSENPPDFDGVLQAEADFVQARKVLGCYSGIQTLLDVLEIRKLSFDDPKGIGLFFRTKGSPDWRTFATHLAEAERHFAAQG